MNRGKINKVFLSSRVAVIPELREKIRNRLIDEDYEVLPGGWKGTGRKRR